MRARDVTLGVEIEGDLVGQRALDVEGDSAPASGNRPVQMAHEHVIGLSRAGDTSHSAAPLASLIVSM